MGFALMTRRKFYSYIHILFLFIFVSTLHAQAVNEKVRIANIDVEGSVSASKELVRINTGLSVGALVSGEDIQKSIKQLFNLGIYSDIQVLKTAENDEGIDLLFIVTEYPRIKEIVIEGNKELKTKDVEERMSLYPGQVLNPVTVERAVDRIKKKYVEKGFLLAEISPVISQAGDSLRKTLTFKIKEGSRVQIKKIRFHGNDTFQNKTLREKMEDTKEDTWWRGADFKPEKFEEDKKKVIEFYRNNGFRNAMIVRDSISYGDNNSDMFLDLFVDEGTRYYFGSTSFEGNELYEEDRLRSGFEFEKGDVYNEEEFNTTIQNISKFYYNDGYIYAQVSPRESIVSRDTVNINFSIAEGDPVEINQILISGNTKKNTFQHQYTPLHLIE